MKGSSDVTTAGSYPESAISSWSGFVYQGKIALYHCLKLILEEGEPFELQLDSTDDFAIYRDGKLVSAHQVKAKVGDLRSAYTTALQKSVAISGDRIKGTKRFFHISVEINDTSDHSSPSGETVKFYSYGAKKYCPLNEIEPLTRALIKEILNKNGSIDSEALTKIKFCIISEKISTKAVEIHKINQIDGVSENEAAYNNRIKSSELISDILSNPYYSDLEYSTAALKQELHDCIEDKLDKTLPSLNDQQYQRTRNLFSHIQNMQHGDLERLCQLIKPSERFSTIQRMDISRYSSLIQKLGLEPILNGIPHYLDSETKFYLPTAISLNDEDEVFECIDHVKREIRENENLLSLLFEYNNLIGSHLPRSFIVESKFTENLSSVTDLAAQPQEDRITKELNLNIIEIKAAEAKLNA
jgi:hypothetical protein